MKSMEQELREIYKKLERQMNLEIAKFSNIQRKGYMGENVVMLDFTPQNFENAKSVAEEIGKNPQIRVTVYEAKRRVAMIF